MDNRKNWFLLFFSILLVACSNANRLYANPTLTITPFSELPSTIAPIKTETPRTNSVINSSTVSTVIIPTLPTIATFIPTLPPLVYPATPYPVLQKTSAIISPDNAVDLDQVKEILFNPWDIVMATAWSPDGNTLAVSAGEYIYLYKVQGWEELITVRVGALTHSLAFSPDGSQLAAGSRDGALRIWNTFSQQGVREIETQPSLIIEAHRKGVNTLAYSPNGQVLASGGNDAVARFWSPTTGENVGIMIGGTFAVPAITFAPHESVLAVVNGDVIRLREIGTESIVGTFLAEKPLYSIAYHPDGHILASGDTDNTVQVWDVSLAYRTGVEKYPEPLFLLRHSGKPLTYRALIWQLTFNPSGLLLASAGGDGTVRIWNVNNGELLKTLQGFRDGVTCISFNPDGRSLATCSLDGSLRIWAVNQ